MGAVLPAGYEDQYPYEKLTRKHTADIQRTRDQQMRKLRKEHEAVLAELATAKRQLAAVREAGIDPDVLLATKEVFHERRK
jgi:hypothetical protein